MTLEEAIAHCPVVAILRGVRLGEVVAIAEALHGAGVLAVEVPLNSPAPFESLAALSAGFGGRLAVGAGTVLGPAEAEAAAAAGASFTVSPNASPVVISRALELGLTPVPGFATATEAFAALAAGARHLKFFPAASLGPAHLAQLMSVLPKSAVVWVVGGVRPADMAAWREAGAQVFGLGSALYRPGQGAAETAERAARAVAAAR